MRKPLWWIAAFAFITLALFTGAVVGSSVGSPHLDNLLVLGVTLALSMVVALPFAKLLQDHLHRQMNKGRGLEVSTRRAVGAAQVYLSGGHAQVYLSGGTDGHGRHPVVPVDHGPRSRGRERYEATQPVGRFDTAEPTEPVQVAAPPLPRARRKLEGFTASGFSPERLLGQAEGLMAQPEDPGDPPAWGGQVT